MNYLRSARRLAVGAALMTALAGLLQPQPVAAQSGMVEVTDLAGRTVAVKKGASRIVLSEGRQLYALAVLDRANPFQRVVAWGSDLKVNDPDAWRKYRAKHPDADAIANLGNPYAADFSAETIVAKQPDLFVLDLGNYFRARETGLIEKLAKVSIPVVVIDWRDDPSQNTLPSLLMLGRILDREAEAQAFADFYLKHMRQIYARVGNLKEKDRPLVFMERAAGFNPALCCNTWGSTNFGKFVEDAGGRNWGSRLFAGAAGGEVSVEKIVADDPDFYFLTGANWAEANPAATAVPLGYDAKPAIVQEKLAALMTRPGLPLLKAAKERRVMALYHQFYNSPYAFVAVEAMAKALHPDRFEDIDPQATWTELHARFLSIAPSGVFWARLQ